MRNRRKNRNKIFLLAVAVFLILASMIVYKLNQGPKLVDFDAYKHLKQVELQIDIVSKDTIYPPERQFVFDAIQDDIRLTTRYLSADIPEKTKKKIEEYGNKLLIKSDSVLKDMNRKPWPLK